MEDAAGWLSAWLVLSQLPYTIHGHLPRAGTMHTRLGLPMRQFLQASKPNKETNHEVQEGKLGSA